jgi:TPR repeat protein
VIDRLVARAQRRPEDPEALYWAAQLAFDGLSDRVPDAMGMMRKSAEKEFPPAMAVYGVALCGGLGVPRDVRSGMDLLNRARGKGEPTAFYQLGRIYFAGAEGVPRNLDRAEDFLKVAVDKGVTRALNQLVKLYGARNDAARVVEYAGKAADAGDVEMTAFLAESYGANRPLPLNDPAKALRLARRGALLEEPVAMRLYAYIHYRELFGQKKDPLLSRRLLQRAADLGDNESAAALEHGKITGAFGVSEPGKGLAALEKLVAAGLPEAKFHLGRALYGDQGEPIKPDRERALELIREAAAAGFLPAQDFLRALDRVKDGKPGA